jgi:hypothetical protein
MNKQIEVKEILIHWAEGKTANYDKFPKAYPSFEAVNKALIPVYEDSLEFDGGYNKVKFTATFKDGETYEGRLDICEKEDNPMRTGNVIGNHIHTYLTWLVNNESSEEATSFLTKYKLY